MKDSDSQNTKECKLEEESAKFLLWMTPSLGCAILTGSWLNLSRALLWGIYVDSLMMSFVKKRNSESFWLSFHSQKHLVDWINNSFLYLAPSLHPVHLLHCYILIQGEFGIHHCYSIREYPGLIRIFQALAVQSHLQPFPQHIYPLLQAHSPSFRKAQPRLPTFDEVFPLSWNFFPTLTKCWSKVVLKIF